MPDQARERVRLVRATAPVTLVLTLACGAGRHQVPALAPGPLPARQQVEVWRRDGVVRWHAVTLTADSITGIPFLQPVSCDSCRRSVPRSEVDSIRLGHPVAGFWKTMALIWAVPIGILIWSCSRWCGPD